MINGKDVLFGSGRVGMVLDGMAMATGPGSGCRKRINIVVSVLNLRK